MQSAWHVVKMVTQTMSLQPLIPANTILEGRLLGGMETTFVARRTILSAGISCVGLVAARMVGGGLLGVWLALLAYNLCAIVADAWCVNQREEGPSVACSVDFEDKLD